MEVRPVQKVVGSFQNMTENEKFNRMRNVEEKTRAAFPQEL